MNVLICITNMPYARSTAQMGSLVAHLLGRPITLLKVITKEEETKTAVSTLELVQKLIETPGAETAVILGTPANEILRKADSRHYSLIVVGAHAIRSFWDPFLQSTTHKVANQATVSVLVARGEPQQLRHLLVCTSGYVSSEIVIQNGAALARAAQAAVTLLHVAETLPAMYAGLDEMEETLPELLQSSTPLAQHLKWASEYLVQAGVPAELKLRRGIVHDEILAEAEEGTYDLIVTGARVEYNVLSSLLMGQITPKIIDSAPCSVLIVRGDL